MIDLDEIKSRINPQYADRRGSESHERKMLCDEIEALRQQLAEKDAEIERLKTVPMKYRRMAFNAQLQDENRELEKQLAASQVREQQLRDGLSWIARVNALDYEYVEMAKKTLADVSQDTSTLEAMIAKTCEVMRERAVGMTPDLSMADIEHVRRAISVLPVVTLEDLK